MKVTNEKTENRQVFLTIEMEPAEVEESLDKSYYRLVGRTNIPGFRKGKAPRAILERYVGKEMLFEEALNYLVPQSYEKAVIEQGIEAIAQPNIEIVQADPVIFKAIVPLAPTIGLGDYQHIQVVQKPVELDEEDVNRVIEQLRHQQATWEPIERPVDFGDLVTLNIESNIEGNPFINQEGAQYQVLHDSSFPALGFGEQLSGMKRDEDKEFSLQFPSEHPRDELAGKEASFKVTVTEIKQEILPELNDEFATGITPDCKSLDLLRERVSADLKLRAEEKAKIDFEEQVIEAVVDTTELEFPPILTEREIARLHDQRLKHWQMGGEGLEEYLRSINKTEDELREELRPLATKRIAQSLVLVRVAEAEEIEVGEAEVDAEIDNLAKSTADNKDELQKSMNTPHSRESTKQLLIIRKTVRRLVEIAKSSNVNTGKGKRRGKSE